jgi:hypothetical protein
MTSCIRCENSSWVGISCPICLVDSTARAIGGRSSSQDRRVANARSCASATFPASDARFVGCGRAKGRGSWAGRGTCRERRRGCSCWAGSGCCARMSRCSRRCWRAGAISSSVATSARRRYGAGWRGCAGSSGSPATGRGPGGRWIWRSSPRSCAVNGGRGRRSGPTTGICACSASTPRTRVMSGPRYASGCSGRIRRRSALSGTPRCTRRSTRASPAGGRWPGGSCRSCLTTPTSASPTRGTAAARAG